MIQLYIALGLLGFLYYNQKKDSKVIEPYLNQKLSPKRIVEIKNPEYKDDTETDSESESESESENDTGYSNADKEMIEKRIQENLQNKSVLQLPPPGLDDTYDIGVGADVFIGNGSILNPEADKVTGRDKLTAENFLLQEGQTKLSAGNNINSTVDSFNPMNSIENSSNMLNKMTGRGRDNFKKTEVSPFFKPEKNVGGFIRGAPNTNEFEKDRLSRSKTRKGELPFEQIKVGSGLGENYGNKPTGGFHQFETQEIIKPKNIDQLRAKNNQKLTYKGMVIKGKSINNKRKNIGVVQKLRPEKFFLNGEERYLKTTGAYLKGSKRLNFDPKYTNRTESRHFLGNAKPSTNKHKLKTDVKKTTKNLYKKDGIRNLHSKNTWSSVEKMSDYGKHTFVAYANERDVTQKRTYKSNFTTVVKAIISPLLDKFKTTKKENTEGNYRPDGNIGVSIPKKLTVHDSNDVARTTIKETTIHNDREGNISVQGPKKNKQYKYDTLPKITVRNTLKESDKNLNLNPSRPKLKQFSNQPIKATIKETTTIKKHHGQPHYNKNSGYQVTEKKAPNTNRQFTSNYEYTGIAGSKNKKLTSYDSSYNAVLNTTKEIISRGRKPTQTGAKKSVGSKDIRTIHKKKMSDSKPPEPRKSVRYSKPQPHVTISNFKDTLSVKNRINPEIIEQLTDNPYNQTYGYNKDTETSTAPEKKNIPKFREKLDVMEDFHDPDALNRKIMEEIEKL